jgi:probable HAF family extracellular repeat protein
LGLDTGWTSGLAWGVSADGTIVSGTLSTTTSSEAFRWTQASGFTRLGDFPGGEFRSEGRGISSDGTTIVGTGTTGYDIPCRSVGGAAFVSLNIPGTGGSALAVSPDGSVIVGYRDIPGQDGYQAFRWTQASGAVFFGDFPGGGFNDWPASYAHGVSADGEVVVGSGMSTEGGRVFVWTSAGGLQDLGDILRAHGIDLSAWAELINATDHSADIWATISADGTSIVGVARHNGNREAFRAYKSDGFLNP